MGKNKKRTKAEAPEIAENVTVSGRQGVRSPDLGERGRMQYVETCTASWLVVIMGCLVPARLYWASLQVLLLAGAPCLRATLAAYRDSPEKETAACLLLPTEAFLTANLSTGQLVAVSLSRQRRLPPRSLAVCLFAFLPQPLTFGHPAGGTQQPEDLRRGTFAWVEQAFWTPAKARAAKPAQHMALS